MITADEARAKAIYNLDIAAAQAMTAGSLDPWFREIERAVKYGEMSTVRSGVAPTMPEKLALERLGYRITISLIGTKVSWKEVPG